MKVSVYYTKHVGCVLKSYVAGRAGGRPYFLMTHFFMTKLDTDSQEYLDLIDRVREVTIVCNFQDFSSSSLFPALIRNNIKYARIRAKRRKP